MTKQFRVVWLLGTASGLMHGDPDAAKYGSAALVLLLAEGWQVHSSVSSGTHAYVILTSDVRAEAEHGGEASEDPDGSGTESAG